MSDTPRTDALIEYLQEHFHGQAADVVDFAEELERELNVANSRIEKLKAFVLPFANCPCCNENEMCVTGCTFGNDCPEEFERMILAREALK